MTTDAVLQPMVRKLRYWNPLTEADEQALLNLPYRVKAMEPLGYVARERDRTTHSCLLLSGFAIRHKIVGDGARQIVAVHMKGDLVDLQNSFLTIADHSVQMLTAGEVAFIPRDAVKQIAIERPAVGMAMWFDTLVDASVFREWIANIGRRNARARLAHLLCEFGLRFEMAGMGDATQYNLPMSQEQLADVLSLTAVHVNRTIKSLEEAGLIRRNTTRAVTIDNWERLAAVGDFDSLYLHLKPNGPSID